MATPENEQKKKWLKSYNQLDREIDHMCDELSRWRVRAQKITTVYSDMPRGGNGENSLEISVEKIIEIEGKINKKIDDLIKCRDDVIKTINLIPDITLQTILKLRYIDEESWPQVCTAIYGKRVDFPDRYDSYLRNIYRWHGKALSQMSLNVTINK